MSPFDALRLRLILIALLLAEADRASQRPSTHATRMVGGQIVWASNKPPF